MPRAEEDTLRRSITVFIDNLPQGVWKVWLYNLFSRFGEILSIYISKKKSKIFGNLFGFVRLGRYHDALRAVNWAIVEGSKTEHKYGGKGRTKWIQRNIGLHVMVEAPYSNGSTEETRPCAHPGKAYGGDMVVITFKDLKERESMFNGGKMTWLKEWFVESSKWESTKSNPCSRLFYARIVLVQDAKWRSSGYEQTTRSSRTVNYYPTNGRGTEISYLDALRSNLGVPKECIAPTKVSTEGITNRNRILSSESKAAWSVTKILGTDYMGKDEEVISRIMVTDEEAELRAAHLPQSNPGIPCSRMFSIISRAVLKKNWILFPGLILPPKAFQWLLAKGGKSAAKHCPCSFSLASQASVVALGSSKICP
ncbi:hypothetical protein Acr_08g0015740 [Actinidia rufa]|uniref:RRM domain-containing protein n=1 Tax=Actinidia rufa TaxID=165716 RepID=A0A7J0F3A8_9ERIC|nr:hypothetical protein Acr_08g0015740 [Actinidia rufa]